MKLKDRRVRENSRYETEKENRDQIECSEEEGGEEKENLFNSL